MNDKSAKLVEVFSSVQGEGLLVGLRQVFVRFYGCNISCTYCDTNIEENPLFCRMERTPGRRDFAETPNPVLFDDLISLIDGWVRGWPGVHHSISITGGEPLLSGEILRELLPELKKYLPIYLETNGLLHEELARLIHMLDHIGMDIKLPSTSGCIDLWQRHEDFLRIAAQKDVFVKIVVSDDTEDWEIERASGIVASVNNQIPVILQPVTLKTGRIGIAPLRILEFQEIASRALTNVRVIAQTHKFIGQM
ncbi:MAG TPA: 7-carboxy-7-deazaguanine synthase QueE [Geobacteraceae bacterium]|nr:7-carboxy-7-deazaguanine synthase QueE [Geobacteraceae bacterium]